MLWPSLTAGETSEWAVTLLCQETAALRAEDRRAVDAQLGPTLHGPSDRQVAAAARAAAYRLDLAGAVARAAATEADRRVSIRPAPDSMARVNALLPVAQGVAVYAALCAAADTARATGSAQRGGEAKSRGQVMADTLVERVTGQVIADAVPLVVNVVMTDRALLAGDPTPRVAGYGRPDLPHAVLRCSGPPHQPRHVRRRRRVDELPQRSRPLRGGQLHQDPARLGRASRHRPRRAAYDRAHHTGGAGLRLDGATTAGPRRRGPTPAGRRPPRKPSS